MRRRIFRRKPFVVEGQPYKATLTAIVGEFVDLRLSIQADFGQRSHCAIRGLRNFAYFFHYGYWDEDGFSAHEQTIEITPLMVATLIRFARRNGWSPAASAANCQIHLTNVEAKSALGSLNSSARDR